MQKKHTFSVLVRNKFGVLARVAGLFSGRGYNISSLTVNETHDPAVSKMTIVTSGDDMILEQIYKQLRKLVEVISVTDLTGSLFIEREIALIKVKAPKKIRAEIIQVSEIFDAKIITVHKDELGIEIHGRADKIDNFIQLMSEYGIIDLARSGRVAISKESADGNGEISSATI
ncbi:MAG: acetolactate synthase small subunit [Lentisphaerae bacterium GWF2_45_14]|nr:MAG: acetolactate synthase small subunit [Lentisphaerae bacterium GWF2_45_14]